MFHTRYVPLVERKRVALEYLDLRQRTKSVAKITKKFTKRDLFFRNFAASKKSHMTQYFSMLRTDIRQFLSTQLYGTFVELHEAVGR